MFDSHLSFSNHIFSFSRACFYHIRDLRHIRPVVDFDTARTIVFTVGLLSGKLVSRFETDNGF